MSGGCLKACGKTYSGTHTRPVIAEHQASKILIDYSNQVAENGKMKEEEKKKKDSTRDRTRDLECVRLT